MHAARTYQDGSRRRVGGGKVAKGEARIMRGPSGAAARELPVTRIPVGLLEAYRERLHDGLLGGVSS